MKAKGSRTERELFHMFFNAGMIAVRAAGSGSTTLPAPDLIVGGFGRYYAIECKATKAKHKYFEKEEIEELVQFAKTFGAIPLVGIRFDRQPWYFLNIKDLQITEKGKYGTSLSILQKKGLTFDELVKK